MLSSDEADFHLTGSDNKQNFCTGQKIILDNFMSVLSTVNMSLFEALLQILE